MKRIGFAMCALLWVGCATTDDPQTSDEEQAVGGLTVTLNCDSGGYTIECGTSVTGGTGSYTYTWTPGQHISGLVKVIPGTGGAAAHAPCNGSLASLNVAVTDSAGNTGSGTGSSTCNEFW